MVVLGKGWVKAAALASMVVLLAACQGDGPDMDDYATPSVAHYERHPIIVTQTGAHVKECGAWPEDMTDVANNEPYENFGCFQQQNIAAMVAYPQDLVKPRTQTPPDEMRRMQAIDKYRAGEQIGSAEEEKQKVEIAKVAGSN